MYSKDLSIIFPIYNEENSIKETLLEWKKEIDFLKIKYEIILAEDGSLDNTKKVLNDIIINDGEKIFLSNIVENKRGYAQAILSSINIANGEFILSVDADGQCDPKDFKKFWEKKNNIHNDILIGNRESRKDKFFRLLISKIFLVFHRILFFSKIKDPSCPYIFCRKKTFLELKKYLNFMIEGFWWGFIAASLKENKKIYQIDINHRKRTTGSTNVFLYYKIPSIAFRNIIGLFKIKFFKN